VKATGTDTKTIIGLDFLFPEKIIKAI